MVSQQNFKPAQKEKLAFYYKNYKTSKANEAFFTIDA